MVFHVNCECNVVHILYCVSISTNESNVKLFLPQVLKGDIKPAVETHEMLYQVMQRHNFLPEAFTTDFQVCSNYAELLFLWIFCSTNSIAFVGSLGSTSFKTRIFRINLFSLQSNW